MAFWVLTDDSIAVDELLAGAGAAALGALLAEVASHQAAVSFRLRIAVAALGLAGLPPFATYLGMGWIAASADEQGLAWVTVIMAACSVLTGGAVLRVAGGVFYGLGDPPAEDRQMAEQASEETGESRRARRRSPLSMIVPAAVLILGALALTFVPHLGQAVQGMAERLQDQAGYDRAVLPGAAAATSVPPAARGAADSTVADVAAGLLSAACAAALAGLALYGRRLPLPRRVAGKAMALARSLDGIQSGVVNDYVTWIVLGVAAVGGVLAVAIR